MSNFYHLLLTFDVRLGNWRIDDPRIPENAEWSLSVYDRNKEEWVEVAKCNRPGEHTKLTSLTILPEGEVSCEDVTVRIEKIEDTT